MSEEAKSLDELDPNPGKGDVDFKRAVLGAGLILSQLGEEAIKDRRNGSIGISATDEISAAVKATADSRRGGLVINSKLFVPSGRYFGTYEEKPDANGDVHSRHDLDPERLLDGDTCRAVPTKDLPKHERKMKTRHEHLLTTREKDKKLIDQGTVGHQHRNGGQRRQVPKVIPEKDRDGYVAMLHKISRPQLDIRSLRKTYVPKFSDNSGRAQSAAKIVNNQVAKRLKKHAVEARNKKIDDLNAVDIDET